MTKIKKIIAVILAITLVLFIGLGTTAVARADTFQSTEQEIVDPDISPDESNFVVQFTEWLKAEYGEEYETYYNFIIEHWGSVEAYLTSLGEKLPEEYQSSWDKFVAWLGEYSPIWATALSIIIVIIVAVVGKKQFNRIIDRIVNTKLKPVVGELNLQSRAIAASLNAQKVLLGNNERFAEAVNELTAAEKELKDE